MMSGLAGLLRGLIVRAIARITDDDSGLQLAALDAHAGQARGEVEVLHPYGFTAHAPAGAVTLLVHVGADQSDPAALPPAHRASRRTGLAVGQVCIYAADGTEILLAADGTIVVKAAGKVRLDTPLLEVTGDIRDRCDAGGVSMAGMRATFDAHTHPENDNGGPTDPPNQSMGAH